MDPLEEKIVNTLNQNNGSMAWQDLIDALDFRERQVAFTAVRNLKNRGVLSRNVGFNQTTGASELTIALIAPS